METQSLYFDTIKKPEHYTTHPSGVEYRYLAASIDGFLSHAFKYLFRRNIKETPLVNFKKALCFVEFEIEHYKNGNKYRHRDKQLASEDCALRQRFLDNEPPEYQLLFTDLFMADRNNDLKGDYLHNMKCGLERLITEAQETYDKELERCHTI